MTVAKRMRFPPREIPPKSPNPLNSLQSSLFPFSISPNIRISEIPLLPRNSPRTPFLDPLLHLPMSNTSKDTHIVVVDVLAASEQDQEALVPSPGTAVQHHPLTEISGSPGHLLLLKLWQREEDLISLRATAIESHLDASKRHAFLLSCLFLTFHAISLTILFSSTHKSHENNICKNWMVPCLLSLITSLVIVSSVQAIVCAYWRGWKELQRERSDARALARCLQELRMKGASFDLSREPLTVRRAKSSSVEVRWHGPLKWFSRNLVTVFLLCVSGLIVTASKFIVCN